MAAPEVIIQKQEYKVDFPTYSEAGRLPIGNCGITFFNTGNTNILINNSFVLTPGVSIQIFANDGEWDTTQYLWSFIPNALVPQTNSLSIIRKSYA